MNPTHRAVRSKRQVVPTPHRGLNRYDALNRDGTWEDIYLDRSELEPIPKLPDTLRNRANFLNLGRGYRTLGGAQSDEWPVIEVHFDETGLILDKTRLHL